MSISTQITRITNDRNTIRNKLVTLGLAQNNDNLDTLAQAIDDIVNRGAVNAEVKEGETYTIPAGYHNGAGTVKGIAGGGNYTLQTKTATPTKRQQQVTADEGYYGLSAVTVEAIPATYQDVTGVTATAAQVLTGSSFVTSDGVLTPGTMPNNGAIKVTLDMTTQSHKVQLGYHNGSGTVSINPQTKNATPTEEQQTISPDAGRVLGSVVVAAIPADYITTTDATAEAGDILTGETAYVAGEKVTGTMPNNGKVTQVLDTETISYKIAAGYHNGTGTVSIVLDQQTVTPTKAEQVIEPEEGKVLSQVTVNAIPANYIDTTNATATAAQILTGVTAYVNGSLVTGTMPNVGAVEETLNTETTSYTVAAGYHNGEGTVSITVDSKEATPTKSEQTIEPDEGHVLGTVTVHAIPANFVDTSDATATAADVLTGKKFYLDNVLTNGTMPNNGAINGTITGLDQEQEEGEPVANMTYTIPAGYTTGGTVTLTNQIETLLAAI